MSNEYLPLFRPGDTVTFNVTTAITAGQLVAVGDVDMSVEPATAGSNALVGVAGHDAGIGDKATIEVGKPIHELTASGAIVRGDLVEAAAGGRVRTLDEGAAYGLALATATDGQAVAILQL